jgi:probable HAF family extracellular repeat protein
MSVSVGKCFAVLAAVASALGMAGQCQAEWSFAWLGRLDGDEWSCARVVSADGSIVVGESIEGEYHETYQPEAFRWTPSGGMVGLGFLPGDAWATGVSVDGSVVVGFSGGVGENPRMAFRWIEGAGMEDLGWPDGGAWSRAMAVSADGSAVVGQWGTATEWRGALLWTEDDGMSDLGSLPGGGIYYVLDVSADGSMVVGSSYPLEAVRWTEDGGMVVLDAPAEFGDSKACGISADGSLVVGVHYPPTGGLWAFVWDAAHGMRDLTELLSAQGVDFGPDHLQFAYDVAFDGQTMVIIGDSTRGAWMATYVIPEPSSLAALVSMAAAGVLACVWRRRRRAA